MGDCFKSNAIENSSCSRGFVMNPEEEGEAYAKIDKLLCEIATEQDPVRQSRLQQGVSTLTDSLGPLERHKHRFTTFLPPVLIGLAAIVMAIYYQMQLSSLQAIVEQQRLQLESQKWG